MTEPLSPETGAPIGAEKPITPLSAPTHGDELWREIIELFVRYGCERPSWQLRDKLVTHLAWARYGAAVALFSEGLRAENAYHADRIAEVMDEGDGFWRACSGCQEGVDGYVSTRDYPHSKTFRCQPGAGCRECGGLGVIWDSIDYGAMAEAMLADEVRDGAAEVLASAVLGFFPPNLCADNANISDQAVVPIDATMGELRTLKAAALAVSEGAQQ